MVYLGEQERMLFMLMFIGMLVLGVCAIVSYTNMLWYKDMTIALTDAIEDQDAEIKRLRAMLAKERGYYEKR